MRDSPILKALLVFLCTTFLEVGWVMSVRLVTLGEAWKIAGWAVLMQAIAYAGLLPVVNDRRLVVAGITGAGVGAVLGMRLALSWS